MNVVVVSATGLIPHEPLGPLSDDVVTRFIVPARTGGADAALVIPLPKGVGARFGDRVSAMMQGNALLRMLLRASPLDHGARFWRALKRDARLKAFVQDAELLVAADRDANYACWNLARRTAVSSVSGYAAAKKELQRRTKTS